MVWKPITDIRFFGTCYICVALKELFFEKVSYLLLCVWVFCLVTKETRSIRIHGTDIMDCGEPPCWYWEPNSGPLQEQNVLLTLSHLSNPWRAVLHYYSLVTLRLLPQTWSVNLCHMWGRGERLGIKLRALHLLSVLPLSYTLSPAINTRVLLWFLFFNQFP